MSPTLCRGADELRDYLLGRLSDAESDEFDRHVQGCPDCERAVAELEGASDSLVRHLRLRPDSSAENRESPWGACLERLRELPANNSATEVSEPAPPTLLHHYRLGEVLGRGGMGVVYRSWHPQLHRDVAVKVLAPQRAADRHAIARFQREMRTTGNLDHPAVVRALDAGLADGAYYLVMEWVDGLDLGRLVRRVGPFSVADACRVVVDAAEALAHAHERDVIHRDLKPSNLMLDRTGRLKVLDFGLAWRPDVEGATSTAGRLLGTLEYLAPEQASGSAPVGRSTDIYGLGATLFKLLTGRGPLEDLEDSPLLRRLEQIASTPRRDIRELRPDVSPELAAIVAQLLAIDPRRRPATAAEVAELLRPFAQGADSAALIGEALRLEAARRSAGAESLEEDSPRADERRDGRHPANAPSRGNQGKTAGRTLRAAWGVLLVTLGLAAGALGVILVLSTGEGEVRVESDVDDVMLSLVGGGAEHKLEVRPGAESVRIRAGRYEVRVGEGADEVVVDHDRLEVRRGERIVVRVSRAPGRGPAAGGAAVAPAEAPQQPVAESWDQQLAVRRLNLRVQLAELQQSRGAKHPEVLAVERQLQLLDELAGEANDGAMYQGRSFGQWRSVVERETDADTLRQGVEALVQLGAQTRPEETLRAFLVAARRLEETTSVDDRGRLESLVAFKLVGGDDQRSRGALVKLGDYTWRSGVRSMAEVWQRLPAPPVLAAIDRAIEERDVGVLAVGLVYLKDSSRERLSRDEVLVRLRRLSDAESSELRGAVVLLNAELDPPDPELLRHALVEDADSLVRLLAVRTVTRGIGDFWQPPRSRNAVVEAYRRQRSADRPDPGVATAAEEPEPKFSLALLREHADEVGIAIGRDPAQPGSNRGLEGFFDLHRIASTALPESSPPDQLELQQVSRRVLRALANEMVQGWERADQPSNAMVMGYLGALGLVDPPARPRALELLHARLRQQIQERDSATAPPENPNIEEGLFGTAIALAQFEGWVPQELLDAQPTPGSFGAQSLDWFRAKVDTGGEPATDEERRRLYACMTWFPVEVAEITTRRLGTLLSEQAAKPPVGAPFVPPGNRSVVVPTYTSRNIEFILAAASRVAELDESYQRGLAQQLSQPLLSFQFDQWEPWRVSDRISEELLKLAETRASLPELQSAALEVAFRMRRHPERTIEAAQRRLGSITLESLKEPAGRRALNNQGWLLGVFESAPDWRPTEEEATLLAQLAGNRLSLSRAYRGTINENSEFVTLYAAIAKLAPFLKDDGRNAIVAAMRPGGFSGGERPGATETLAMLRAVRALGVPKSFERGWAPLAFTLQNSQDQAGYDPVWDDVRREYDAIQSELERRRSAPEPPQPPQPPQEE